MVFQKSHNNEVITERTLQDGQTSEVRITKLPQKDLQRKSKTPRSLQDQMNKIRRTRS